MRAAFAKCVFISRLSLLVIIYRIHLIISNPSLFSLSLLLSLPIRRKTFQKSLSFSHCPKRGPIVPARRIENRLCVPLRPLRLNPSWRSDHRRGRGGPQRQSPAATERTQDNDNWEQTTTGTVVNTWRTYERNLTESPSYLSAA